MGWQVTTTTLQCDFVNRLVTIMVYPDGSAKCAYVNRCSKTKGWAKRLKTCKWPECPVVAKFCSEAMAM